MNKLCRFIRPEHFILSNLIMFRTTPRVTRNSISKNIFFFVEEKLHNYPPLSCYVFLFLFFLPFFFELGDCGSTVDMTESNLCIDVDSNDGDTAA
jgi:hypothetical protein